MPWRLTKPRKQTMRPSSRPSGPKPSSRELSQAQASGSIEASAKAAVDQAVNKSAQSVLDDAKLAMLPFFYVVIPLFAIVLICNLELVLPLVRPSWRVALWRKLLYLAIDFFCFVLLVTALALLMYFKENPEQACAMLGTAVAGPLGAVFGWAACKVGA